MYIHIYVCIYIGMCVYTYVYVSVYIHIHAIIASISTVDIVGRKLAFANSEVYLCSLQIYYLGMNSQTSYISRVLGIVTVAVTIEKCPLPPSLMYYAM